MEKTAEQYQQEINQLTAQLQAVQTDYAILSLLQGHKTAIDHLPPEVRSKSLVDIVKRQLEKNKAELIAGANGYPELKKIDGSNFYSDSNILFTNETFVEDALKKNSLLIEGEQQDNQQQEKRTEQRPPVRQNMLSALAQNALADLEHSENNKITIG